MMDNRHLESFVAVARRLSFTQAANDLSYAQSTVTGHVRMLERSLGVTLFERLPGKIRLTSAGERLLPYAENIMDLATAARSEIGGEADPSGNLSVGTMESITAYRLLPLIEHMHLRFPQVHLTLRPSICAETCEAIRACTYDCGFVIDSTTEFTGVESTVLCVEPLTLVAAPDHRLVGDDKIDISALRAERIIGTEPGCAYRDLFESLLAQDDVEPFPIVEIGTTDVIKRGVAEGMGIALLPTVAVSQELRAGTLAGLEWTPPFRLYTQLVRRPGRPNPALQTLVDTARQLIAEE